MLSLLLIACKNNKQIQTNQPLFESRSIDSVISNPMIISVIDSFILQLPKDKNDIYPLGYIRIVSHTNNELKILVEATVLDTFFSRAVIDDYFYKNNVYFGIDYNKGMLFKSNDNLKSKLISRSKVYEFEHMDIALPVWLIQFDNYSIKRINKNAVSFFGPYVHNQISYFTDKGIVHYELNEWSEVLNEEGIIIDTFDGK